MIANLEAYVLAELLESGKSNFGKAELDSFFFFGGTHGAYCKYNLSWNRLTSSLGIFPFLLLVFNSYMIKWLKSAKQKMYEFIPYATVIDQPLQS